jgi:hypothetical protein
MITSGGNRNPAKLDLGAGAARRRASAQPARAGLRSTQQSRSHPTDQGLPNPVSALGRLRVCSPPRRLSVRLATSPASAPRAAAIHAGVAPIPASSGKTSRHPLAAAATDNSVLHCIGSRSARSATAARAACTTSACSAPSTTSRVSRRGCRRVLLVVLASVKLPTTRAMWRSGDLAATLRVPHPPRA